MPALRRCLGAHRPAQGRDPNHVPFPWEDMERASRRGLLNASIDWCTQLVRSLLDWAASRVVPERLSGKLVKGGRSGH